jgi:hypothetical protein
MRHMTHHLLRMTPEQRTNDAGEDVAIWQLPYAARLGSSVRSKGIFQHVRLRLPAGARKSLTVKAGELILRLPASPEGEAWIVAASQALEGVEDRPVLPREIEDILAITSTERHRWLKDGRLPSAGTKTVKLKGRARAITFHVFDPRMVEDLLDRDAVAEWRELDALAAAENRRQAACNRRLRANSPQEKSSVHGTEEVQLEGWDKFERLGLLR